MKWKKFDDEKPEDGAFIFVKFKNEIGCYIGTYREDFFDCNISLDYKYAIDVTPYRMASEYAPFHRWMYVKELFDDGLES